MPREGRRENRHRPRRSVSPSASPYAPPPLCIPSGKNGNPSLPLVTHDTRTMDIPAGVRCEIRRMPFSTAGRVPPPWKSIFPRRTDGELQRGQRNIEWKMFRGERMVATPETTAVAALGKRRAAAVARIGDLSRLRGCRRGATAVVSSFLSPGEFCAVPTPKAPCAPPPRRRFRRRRRERGERSAV